jgi:hypothetical protein
MEKPSLKGRKTRFIVISMLLYLDPGQPNQSGSTTLYTTFFIGMCVLFTSMLKKVVLIRLQKKSEFFKSFFLPIYALSCLNWERLGSESDYDLILHFK